MKLRRVAFRITAVGFYETNDHFVATQPLNNLCSRTVNYISAAPTALKGDFPLAVWANAFAVVLGFSDRYIMLAGSTVRSPENSIVTTISFFALRPILRM